MPRRVTEAEADQVTELFTLRLPRGPNLELGEFAAPGGELTVACMWRDPL
jgi:hypothetical protein